MSGSPSGSPLLYLRTIRRLGAGQVFGRPFRPLVRRLLPVIIRSAHYRDGDGWLRTIRERLRRLEPGVLGLRAGPVERDVRVAEEVTAGRFRFLSRAEELGLPDWNARPVSRLWTYHLHYFEFAESLARAFLATGRAEFLATLERLVTDWIDRTRPFRGDAWDPYPTSVRIDHWIRALALSGDSVTPEFRGRWIASLDRQARYLSRFVEHHLRGNHLIKNFKALVMAGLILPGPKGRRLLRTGVAGLEREIDRQVLPDGVHYERCPMYHAIVLEDLLHALRHLEAFGIDVAMGLRDAAARMSAAASVLVRPDGTWHQFGDSAEGHAPSAAALLRLAERTGIRTPETAQEAVSLPDAGFFGWMPSSGRAKFLIRCGRNAPAEQPGHAHCDLLGFELWLNGVPIIVDTGVRDYEDDAVRRYVRSTGAHTTVQLGSGEQSEIWGRFRVGRQARARVTTARGGPSGDYEFSGECVTHHSPAAHRRVVRGSTTEWSVTDRVDRAWSGPVTSAVHFHPLLRVVCAASGVFELRRAGHTFRLIPSGFDRISRRRGGDGRVRGVWYPAFGVEEESTGLEMTIDRNDGRDFGFRVVVVDEGPSAGA